MRINTSSFLETKIEDKFYVLDRNGNEVKELSFEIDSGENNIPISIFDYEKNRN